MARQWDESLSRTAKPVGATDAFVVMQGRENGADEGIEKWSENGRFAPFLSFKFWDIPPIVPPNTPVAGERQRAGRQILFLD
ncbi:hypothetical protein [Novosphingobium humi]|uniref:hypothetical protein n=1 Tax=Novosphingobium humi TaxID=2282397 RepID=UPI0025B14FDA|nr:hypothetical protein [Novosphingobium humi]WJS98377.1 hypothetical protein NYQ05_14835 [Novosphingobium humi]